MDVMTPKHERWQEFCDRLEGPEGCDFKEDAVKGITWKCKGRQDKTFAEAILKDMEEFDVEESLRFFEAHGGWCDCEILFNVEDSVGC